MSKFLDIEQRQNLLEELHQERHRKNADRIWVILLLDSGWKYKKICEAYFIDESTIRNWRKRFVEGGVERLMNDRWNVKRCSLSLEQLLELDVHLMDNTYRRAKDVGEYIKKKYKVELEENSVLRILRSIAYSFKKPKKVLSSLT